MDKKLVGMQVDPGLNGGLKVNITDPYDLTQLIGYRLDENSLLRDRGVDLEKLHNLKLPEKDFYGGKALQGNAQEPGIYEISE